MINSNCIQEIEIKCSVILHNKYTNKRMSYLIVLIYINTYNTSLYLPVLKQVLDCPTHPLIFIKRAILK